MQAIQVRLDNVSRSFTRKTGDTIKGLDQINLEVQAGEIIGVIGTNGAGKSTLFNAITGHLALDEGTIEISGDNISQLRPMELARRIGRVFQNASLGTAPRMTVFENLMLAAKRGERRGLTISLTKENQAEMAAFLANFKLDLENRLDVPIENLSGGQRQAVSLVMATLKRPELLLLDEHTAALDPRTARQVMGMTMDLIKEHQLTTFMITHRLQDALNYSDRIIVMHRGQIRHVFTQDEIQALTPGDLYEILEQLVDQAAED